MTNNELKLLEYLVGNFQLGKISPDDPKTHLPYSKVLRDLGFPNDYRTPGDSLNKHAMGGLAEWLLKNKLPAITGIIVNKLTDPNRGGIPSKLYFTYHNRQDMDFKWQQGQIKKAIDLDWDATLKEVGVFLEGDFKLPEEVSETFIEGAKKTITVNSYERNSAARNACIKEHGVICVVCDFNFELTYGERGKGFIHVHHLRPLAELGQEYEVDPINDLRPVCPNCHAMLHQKENISIEQLQREMSFAKALQ
ncbi:HNH endonuclease [Alcaligenes faecalis]|uniref:HNH endonuclease n=1 Tax=Alcaligenes faecalis TaxID=511 RepID=A0AAE9HDQ4_ALCFA|nr:HNH endonuclease [Alcaligenes faecalis]UPL23054.1 HNH endonuclease [Alcaligenes faecalis]